MMQRINIGHDYPQGIEPVERWLHLLRDDVKCGFDSYGLWSGSVNTEQTITDVLFSEDDILKRNKHLIVIGEGDSGKTEFLKRLHSISPTAGKDVFIRLRDYVDVSAETLFTDVVAKVRLNGGAEGSGEKINIILDGIDEAKKSVRVIEKLLCDDTITGRSRLILSSRPEDVITPLLKCDIEPLQLCPFQLSDVKSIADQMNVDWLDFFTKIRSMRILSMCSKPEMCIQLMKYFNKKGLDGGSAKELLWNIARRQCAEHRDGEIARDDAGYISQWAETDKAGCAAWLAAAMRLSGKDSIWKGKSLDCPDSAMPVLDLVTPKCPEGLIIETVRTRLFEPLGNCLRFRIGTEELIDFLSAKWIADDVSSFNARQFLCPVGYADAVPNTMMLSWAMLLGADVGSSLLRSQPEAYLGSQDLVAKIGHKRLYRALQDKYLRYPEAYRDELLVSAGNLSSQETTALVKRDLLNAAKDATKARFAARVARLCEDSATLPSLINVVLDESVPTNVREKISYDMRFLCASLDKMTVANAIKELLPVVKVSVSSHDVEIIKGNALHCLFPEFISARELFSVLEPPLHKNWYGAYTSFIEDTLLPGIQSYIHESDATLALGWARMHIADHEAFDYMGVVARQIFSHCWQWVGVPAIRDRIVSCIAVGFSGYNSLMNMPFLRRSETRRIKDTAFDLNGYKADRKSRLLVLEDVLRQPANRTGAHLEWHLAFCETPLYFVEDFCEMSERLLVGNVPYGWLECVKSLVNKIDDLKPHMQALKSLHEQYPDVQEFDYDVLENIRRKNKAELDRIEKNNEESKRQGEREIEKLRKHICDIASDPTNDAIGFSNLSHLLFSTRCVYKVPNEPDLTVSPQWANLTGEQRQACVRKAKALLLEGSNHDGWEPYSVACAVELVYRFDPNWINALDKQHQLRVLRSVLAISYFAVNSSVLRHFVPYVFGLFPNEAGDALVDVMLAELRSGCSSALHHYRGMLTARSVGVLLSQIKKELWNYETVANALEELVSHEAAHLVHDFISSIIDWHDRKPPGHDCDSLVRVAFSADPLRYEESLKRWLRNGKWFDAWLGNALMESGDVDDMALTIVRCTPNVVVEIQAWLEAHYPSCDKPIPGGVYSPTREDEIYDLKDRIVYALMKFCEEPAVEVFAALAERFQSGYYGELLKRKKFEIARAKASRLKWRLEDLKTIASSHTRDIMLVETSESLLDVLMALLEKYEKYLQEWKKGARDLWNETSSRGGFCKGARKGESALSDHLARYIKLTISKLVVNREPEVSYYKDTGTGKTKKGLSDIVVEVSGRDGRPNPKVIIEVKGDWNKEVKSGLSAQLVDRYLRKNSGACGIFLCGCFNAKDSIKEYSTPKLATRALRKQLSTADKKYKRLVRVRAVDCSM